MFDGLERSISCLAILDEVKEEIFQKLMYSKGRDKNCEERFKPFGTSILSGLALQPAAKVRRRDQQPFSVQSGQ